MNDFVNLGPVEKVNPDAHPADPRRMTKEHSNGLTKREYFAAMAMQALIGVSPNKVEFINDTQVVMVSVDYEAAAIGAKLYADALIKELAK